MLLACSILLMGHGLDPTDDAPCLPVQSNQVGFDIGLVCEYTPQNRTQLA
jgi:hypothetical protein